MLFVRFMASEKQLNATHEHPRKWERELTAPETITDWGQKITEACAQAPEPEPADEPNPFADEEPDPTIQALLTKATNALGAVLDAISEFANSDTASVQALAQSLYPINQTIDQLKEIQ